jgi:signal transduction histidine kinase
MTHIIDYLNPAFARLVGRDAKDLVGRPFGEAVPEGSGNGCIALFDRVYRTGTYETLIEQEHRQSRPEPVYWSYAVWAMLGPDERPLGVLVQVTDTTETARFRSQAAAVNEALILSAIRQDELVSATEALNAQLREAHDRLEGRVAKRTAELAAANAAMRIEIENREAAEADRQQLLGMLATAQELERRRIARELHDQMAQLLTALGLELKALETALPDALPARVQLPRLREITDQIGREIHQIALDLRPTSLDDLGLQAALANYTEHWAARAGIELDFQTVGPETVRLPEAVETVLYRVVQETLTNVVRHAGARRVSLVLQFSPNEVVVVVEDDGIGFDTEAVTTPSRAGDRLGLLGMRERLALVSGALTVESAIGRGTTIIARIPLPTRGSAGLNG